ncbi:MAG: radical SAM family heme chaperone HemW [Saprospiraceae bacterium]|jgi:oxygen-independent coproporphyrinogen-3 oxidase
MSGIYVHIPFCRKACHYCNFHFSTQTGLQEDMVWAICREIEMRADYLEDKHLDSIYFGGGTPSLLSEEQLNTILDKICAHFFINEAAEITLEANPDDLSEYYLKTLTGSGVNRLSIGVQSFFDDELIWMNRSHNVQQAEECIANARAQGIQDISIDLIFALPGSTTKRWQANLEKFIKMQLDHLSCYGLTVEPRTALEYMVRSGKTGNIDERKYEEQFRLAEELLGEASYERYEISNYAKDGRYAKHNSSYWKGEEYLGLGPSAHSFNGISRRWNISHNSKYINCIKTGDRFYEEEYLSEADRFNEYIMTGLRTKWGCSENKLKTMNADYFELFRADASKQMHIGLMEKRSGNYYLKGEGWLMADAVMASLFIES